tara:strand:- start:1082 stop:1249 length:168 start_codon:yes stop_codon:yes gene_type:complete
MRTIRMIIGTVIGIVPMILLVIAAIIAGKKNTNTITTKINGTVNNLNKVILNERK